MSAKKVDFVLNVATGVVSLFLLAGLVRAWFGGSDSALSSGRSFNVPWVTAASNRETLILGLQTTCAHCRASVPLYRDILASNAHQRLRIVAAFPEEREEALSFLDSVGLNVPEVQQIDFSKLQIEGTPALIFVGRDGRIRRSWVGRLDTKREAELFDFIDLERQSAQKQLQVREDSGDLSAILARTTQIVDVRPRLSFLRAHIRGAVGIPRDELEARAVHELHTDRPLFMYCDHNAPCEARLASEGLSSYCQGSAVLLRSLGFGDVRPIRVDLGAARKLGIGVDAGLRTSE